MRNHFVHLLAACAALNATAWALKPGDPVTPDALGKAEIIQGAVPKAWEPGKVYLIECWTTTCAPCIVEIPHLDALYDRYKDQGLVVVGASVWADPKDKVEELVKTKGDGMSYPVIVTGAKDSAFDTEWLKPASVSAIPYAFVVKDGKFLFGIHPGRLTADSVAGLLAGGEKQDAVVKSYTNEIMKNACMELMIDFQRAAGSGNLEAMSAKFAALEKLDPTHDALPSLRMRLSVAKKDWDGFAQSIQALPDERSGGMLFHYATQLDEEPVVSEAALKAILEKLLKSPGTNSRPMSHVLISRFQWRTGDKQAAIASANLAMEKSEVSEAVIYAAYANSLETDKPQTYKEVNAAMVGAARKGRR